MLRAFHSEWAKLLRRGQLLGSWGTMAGFAVLLTLLLLANAGTLPPPPPECTGDAPDQAACAQAIAQRNQEAQQSGPAIDIARLEEPGGLSFSFSATGQLLGIIALVVAAANVATEYTSGTLKVLLVREPRRPVLLAGKLAALWTFILAGITLTVVLCVLVSAAMAAGRGIDTGSWWTGEAWSALGQAYLNVTAASFVWALMGATLAFLFRSGFPAIGIGIAYPLVVEGLLGLVLPDVVKWMPGSVLGRLATGDAAEAFGAASTVSYAAAAGLTLAYAVVFAVVSSVLLVRRDVN